MMNGDGTKYRIEHVYDQELVRNFIATCQDLDHVQQVAYSTYHDALTQICFKCKVIRTTIPESDII